MARSMSNGAGNSFANAPGAVTKAQRDSGWDTVARKVSHWDFTEGRLPQ